jgi:hypothetical protein
MGVILLRSGASSYGARYLSDSRKPGSATAIERRCIAQPCDALFTRLDGEWWMRFSGDDGSLSSEESTAVPPKKEKLRPLPAG